MNYDIAPPQASTFAPKVDALFYVISALTAFFTIVVFALVIFFAIKYRKGSKVDRSNIVHDSHKIELAWSLPPLFLGLGIFAWGAHLFIEMRTMPKDAIEIFVIGKQWMWHVQHPNGVRENNEIHVPLGKKVKLTMISQDVIHAMYIPAFRAQYQVIPGRYTTLWFEPTKEGKFPLFCNMYCGTQHSEMGGYVYVVKPDEYTAFLDRGGDRAKPGGPLSLVAKGKELYDKLNCQGCHELNDNVRGPSLHGVVGSQVKLRTGESVLADDDYLRQSIVRPSAQIVNGYENTMPQDYQGQLSEEQIRELIEYIKTLSGKNPPAATTPNEGMNP